MKPVSIIMKVWNAQKYLELCIKYILMNSDIDFELIIIDNASKPGVVQILDLLAKSDERVTVIKNSTNMGPAKANIQGFLKAQNELICLIDSDVLVPQGWLANLVNDLDQNLEIALLAPTKYDDTIPYPFNSAIDSRRAWFKISSNQVSINPIDLFREYSNNLSIDDFGKIMCQSVNRHLKFYDAPPGFFSSCCVIGRKSVINTCGGIADPRFAGYGSEDVDLCWRIGEFGGRIAKTNSVYVHHFHQSCLKDNGLDVASSLVIANQILYHKWQEKLLLHLHKVTTRETMLDYLQSHFIFQPLSENTSFISDLRSATGYNEIPNRIIWRPHE